MPISKEKIIVEIKRLSEVSDSPPGKGSFEQKTGIKASEWEGRYWTKWSDALIEAGLTPNQFGTPAYDEQETLKKLAAFTRELGHIPNKNEIRLRKRTDPDLPGDVSIRSKFGGKEKLIARLLEFIVSNPDWSDLTELLEAASKPYASGLSDESVSASCKVGYVYLIKHGNRREYKIGFTYNTIRREGEISIQLPEQISPIHYIETDDPSGIEAYWHKRFAEKRKNGEWFDLSAIDVKVFKRWKKIY